MYSLFIFSALEALVNFSYSGKLQICEETVEALLVGANFLNLYEVKESCCNFLIGRYSVTWGIIIFPQTYCVSTGIHFNSSIQSDINIQFILNILLFNFRLCW